MSLFIFTLVQTAECGLKFERETEGSRSIAGPDTSAESQCRLQTLYLRNLGLIIIHLFSLITPRERERGKGTKVAKFKDCFTKCPISFKVSIQTLQFNILILILIFIGYVLIFGIFD